MLRAALLTPLTGSLGGFGRAGATALGIWARSADLPAALAPVTLDVWAVTEGRAVPALRQAASAVPHLLFGPYGSGLATTVAGATGRTLWNHGGASAALRRPAYPSVVNVLAPATTYFAGALEAVAAADPATPEVTVVHGDSGFPREVARGAAERATALGMPVRTHEFPTGQAAAAAAGAPGGDLLLVAGRFEDEQACARVLLRRRWRAAGFVMAGVDEVVAGTGIVPEGLLGPAQWVARAAPDPDEGPSAAWFVRRFREVDGSLPPYPAAQAFATGVIAARCVRAVGGAEDGPLLQAASTLRCRTLLGDFRLDPGTGEQVGLRPVTVQWQDGARRVVWPPEQAEAALRYPLAAGRSRARD